MYMQRRILVITVHGIRTFGQWQERLQTLAKVAASTHGDEVTFKHKHFGYFSVFKFLNPLARRAEAQRFISELKTLLDVGSVPAFDRVCLVGHSFGTHLIAHALQGLPTELQRKVDTVILSGSVLPTLFPWNGLLGSRVVRVVNDCGNKDWILPINALLPFGSGVAGRNGFEGIFDENFSNRYFEFGHSGYFYRSYRPNVPADDNWFMTRYWVPLLLDNDPIELVDERRVTPLSGLTTSLVDRTERLKWVLPVLIISLALSAVVYQLTLQERARVAREERDRQTEVARQEHDTRYQNLARQFAGKSLAATEGDDAVTGTLLAIEAFAFQSEINKQSSLIEVRQSLNTALLRDRETAWLLTEKPATWALSHRKGLLAIADEQGDIRIVRAATGQTIKNLRSKDGRVSSLSFSPNDSTLLVMAGGVASVWELDGENVILTAKRGLVDPKQAVFCGGSQRIATKLGFGLGEDGIVLWESGARTALTSFGGGTSFDVIQCNHDGTRLTLYEPSSAVRLVDTKRDRPLATFSSEFTIEPPLFSPDGTKLLLVKEDSALLLVDAITGTSIRPLQSAVLPAEPKESFESWGFSRDGRYVVAGSDKGTVFVWNSTNGAEIKKWKVSSSPISSAVLDQNNKRILVASRDGSVRIHDLQNGSLLTSLPGHAETFVKAIFDPYPNDGEVENRVVSAGADGVVMVWDIERETDPILDITFKTNLPGLSDVQLQNAAVIGILRDNGFVAWNALLSHRVGNMKIYAPVRRWKSIGLPQPRPHQSR
jgi:WD40 repeat protein